IEPDVSTTTSSAARALPLSSSPDAVTVTTALTSAAPVGRNSFWYVSALNVFMVVPSVEPHVDDGDRDVVVPAGADRRIGEPTRDRERAGRGRQLPDQPGQVGRPRRVVPETVGAEHQQTGSRRAKRHDLGWSLGRIRTNPAGDRPCTWIRR